MTIVNGVESPIRAMSPWRRWTTNIGAALTLLVRPPRIRPARRWLPPTRHLAGAALAVVAIILAGMVLLDSEASNAAAKLPSGLIDFFNWITDFGKAGWFLWPLGLLFLALAALPPIVPRFSQLVVASLMVRVGFLFTAIALPSLFGTIVKRLIGRARPGVTGVDDPYAFSPLIWRADYASLPSGHATTAFAVLAAFGIMWPRARPVLLLFALAIAASRVVITAHYPTDVAAGALVGIVGVLLVRRYFALRRLGFSVGPDGLSHQYPGPSFRRIKSVARNLLGK